MMNKRWTVYTPNPRLQVVLSDYLRIHPTVAQLLINRSIMTTQEAEDFLRADLSRMHDPLLLMDMDKADRRIRQARERKEKVLVFGDYDVDGVTSSVILNKVLKRLGLDVVHYIPHRMREGYGLNAGIVDFARQNNVGLLISVDCGVTAIDEVDLLNAAGIEVIVIDHHEPPQGRLPAAAAVIDPKRKDCPYPYKGLVAAGLAYKLAQLMIGPDAKEYLELAALGTIADVAELNGENRILAREGLAQILATKNIGLKALMKEARLAQRKIRTHTIGFVLGPRINASGRLGSAQKALRLLLSEDPKEAASLAKDLEEINRKRQKTQNEIVEEALRLVEKEMNFNEHKVIIVSKEGWHQGVVGIVASRLVDRFYRPAIVISLNEGLGTGSARSVDGFHMFEALNRCSPLLKNYGGHKHAAGLTIEENQVLHFRELINSVAGEILKAEHLVPTLEIDCELSISDLDIRLARFLERLEPFGEGNPYPLFCSRRLTLKGAPAVLSRDTLKFWVTDGKNTVSAVGFGMASYCDMLRHSPRIDLAYSLTIDEWNKAPTIQLKVKDIRPSETP